jgi:general stress protein 26
MEGSKNGERDFKHLKEMIEDMKVGMLTTVDADGTLRSRPLQTVGVDDDCTLWFFTSESSPKVAEAEAERGQVNVSYSSNGKTDYVSVSGRAALVRDRAKMEALYTKWIEVFFPKGLDDPDLALLRVQVEKAEYWDSPATAAGRLFALAKGLITKNPDAVGENRKIGRPRPSP